MPDQRECPCCGGAMGFGTVVKYKPGTAEAVETPGSFRLCGICMKYEFDEDLMQLAYPPVAKKKVESYW